MFESFVYSVYWTRKDYVVEGIFANSVAMLLNSLHTAGALRKRILLLQTYPLISLSLGIKEFVLRRASSCYLFRASEFTC